MDSLAHDAGMTKAFLPSGDIEHLKWLAGFGLWAYSRASFSSSRAVS